MLKKFTALLLCLVLVFALCACAKEAVEPENTAEVIESSKPEVSEESKVSEAPEDKPVGMANPRTEYSSLDEINGAVGGNLMHPAVMGVTENSFAVIDCGDYKIAEYQFTVAGYDYTFRCAKTSEDISGVYMGGNGTAFSDAETDGDNIQFNSDNEYKCARWFVDDLQYVLTVNDKGEMDDDTFSSIADEMMNSTLVYGS